MSDKEDLTEAWQAFCEDTHADFDDTEMFEIFKAGWEAYEALHG